MKMRTVNLHGINEYELLDFTIESIPMTREELGLKCPEGKNKNDIARIDQRICPVFLIDGKETRSFAGILGIVCTGDGALRFISDVGNCYDLFITKDSDSKILWNIYNGILSAGENGICKKICDTYFYDIIREGF